MTVRYAQWLHPSETEKQIDPVTVAAYREFLKEGDFCIDIGAHTGDSTLPLALAVGASGCVLALEPNPHVYPVLEKNARMNAGVANIKTIMAAAAAQEGFMEFEYSDSGFCNGGRHEGISTLRHGHAFKLSVFCVNIARELEEDFGDRLPRLRFIKMDAEGYDLYVARALKEVIVSRRPIVKAEVFKRTDRRYRLDLLEFFEDLGYVVHKIEAEPAQAGPRLTTENVEKWRHYDILCLPADTDYPANGVMETIGIGRSG
jgi:FkbM family methyltransferase